MLDLRLVFVIIQYTMFEKKFVKWKGEPKASSAKGSDLKGALTQTKRPIANVNCNNCDIEDHLHLFVDFAALPSSTSGTYISSIILYPAKRLP